MTYVRIKVPNWIDYIFALPVLLFRRVKYGYSFRRIPLGEDRFALVDQQDYYRLNHFNWIPKGSGERCYAVRLVCDSKHIKFLSMHREIMGSPKGLQIDHRNRKRLDNRRDNLRTATNSQNQYNKNKTKRKTSSIYIGVTFVKSIRRWRAQITFNRKNIFLGDFDNEIEAARAYDRGAMKYHGEFARLNFPQPQITQITRTKKNYLREVIKRTWGLIDHVLFHRRDREGCRDLGKI